MTMAVDRLGSFGLKTAIAAVWETVEVEIAAIIAAKG